MVSTPLCLPATHNSQTAVRYSGKAMTCLSVSIQAPGLGSQLLAAALLLMATIGAAIPTPSAAKIISALTGGWVRAKPSALPIKGAVQGLATTTASTPVKKLPRVPGALARPAPRFIQRFPKSTRPESERPISANR